jgi:hypothetical protein
MFIHFYFVAKHEKKQVVKTFIADANGYLWVGLSMSFVVLFFVFIKIGWQYCFPFYTLLYGLGTFISGSLLKFKPFVVGGVCSMIVAAIIPYVAYNNQILLAALSILISYIIPGHILRLRYQKNKNL